MANLLNAIINIKARNNFDLSKINTISKTKASSENRANNMGDALEFFIKDSFCDSYDVKDAQEKRDKYSETFSYMGNQNNPPDIIIKKGDAIEVKKIDGVKPSELALNSSYPKSKLYSDSPMITEACKKCEEWKEKDMVYIVGFVDEENLKALTIVYGDCYAASREIYEKIKDKVSSGLKELDVELADTNELGRVNKVDPLGITNLRIRGMWTIQNPLKVFSEHFKFEKSCEFALRVLMKEEKYNSFSEKDRKILEKDKEIKIQNVKIQEPDNPAKQIKAKLISWCKK